VFANYQESCVYAQHNESFLSSNLRAGAFNYASDGGHSIIFKGLSDFNTQSSESCSKYTAEAKRSYDLLLKDSLTTASNHENVANNAKILQNCVNLTEMDVSVKRADGDNMGLLDYFAAPIGSFGAYSVTPETCDVSLITTYESDVGRNYVTPGSMFNCSKGLPTCTLSCKGTYLAIFKDICCYDCN
jgi:hypothetical protein